MINHATHSPYFTSVRKISGFRSKLLYVLLRTRGRILSGLPAARHSPARLRATQSGSGYFGTFVPFARWRIYLMFFNPPLSKINFRFWSGREDLNLRHSAPKAVLKTLNLLGFSGKISQKSLVCPDVFPTFLLFLAGACVIMSCVVKWCKVPKGSDNARNGKPSERWLRWD